MFFCLKSFLRLEFPLDSSAVLLLAFCSEGCGSSILHFPAGTYAKLQYINKHVIDSETFCTGFLILLMPFVIFGLLTLIGD